MFGLFRGNTQPLIGRWRLAGSDDDLGGDDTVEMEFFPDGRLVYTILAGEKRQVMNLTYKVSGQTIISSQASHPREERTAFGFGPDGSLILTHEKKRSWFYPAE